MTNGVWICEFADREEKGEWKSIKPVNRG